MILILVFTTICVGIALLYAIYPPFRYEARMTTFYVYLLCTSIVGLPVFIYNGRCTKNLKLISRMMVPIRKALGLTSELRKLENMIEDEPCIIVSNHQSSIDVLGMAELYPPDSSFMGKHTLLYAGPIGLALWLCGGVFVKRSNHKSSQDVVEHVANEVLRRKLKLWIFPEGTRSHKKGMLPFKKGAFNIAVSAQIPIVPVVFKSYEDFYNKKERKFILGKYVAEVLPHVKTEGMTLDDVPELSDKIREQMLSAFYRLSDGEKNKNNNNASKIIQ
ncbi:1-acyl-sn-glycerol-3-phosphate acyltransferase alpha-like [Styela clava]